MDIRKVVVIVSPEIRHNEVVGRFTARIVPIGLTGYGDDEDAALAKVKRMFASWVDAHRAKGDLVEWLNRSGLEWDWDDEYDGALEREYVSSTKEPEKTTPSQSADASLQRASIEHSQEYRLAA